MPLPLTLIPEALARRVASTALEPRLAKLESEGVGSIAVRLHQWTPTATEDLGEIRSAKSSDPPFQASGRLCFRPNHGGDLYLFSAEVLMLPEVLSGTGFTGFEVNGSVRHTTTPPVVTIRGYSLRYNQREFDSHA